MIRPLIFHADDFNLTRGINRGIIRSFKEGVVRSTSIMTNLPGFEESISLLKESPGLDVGVHINLTFGKPLSELSEVRSLVDDSGTFWRKPLLLKEMAKASEVEKEIRRQFKLCLDTGIVISHLDTHHHLHAAFPLVLDILISLAKEHKLGVRSVNHEMRDKLQKAGIPTPDNFNESFYGKDNISVDKFRNVIDTAPNGFCEIMCHPGYVDDELKEKSSYNDLREIEMETLTNPKVLEILRGSDANPTGFKELLKFYPGFEKPESQLLSEKENIEQ